MLAFMRESRKWQACNFDFCCRGMKILFRIRAAECCESYYLIRSCEHRFKQREDSHFYRQYVLLDPKEMKRQQKVATNFSKTAYLKCSPEWERGVMSQETSLWTALTPESPWCQSHRKWCPCEEWSRQVSVNCCVQTPSWERKIKECWRVAVLIRESAWWKSHDKTPGRKYGSGLACPFLEIFRKRCDSYLKAKLGRGSGTGPFFTFNFY